MELNKNLTIPENCSDYVQEHQHNYLELTRWVQVVECVAAVCLLVPSVIVLWILRKNNQNKFGIIITSLTLCYSISILIYGLRSLYDKSIGPAAQVRLTLYNLLIGLLAHMFCDFYLPAFYVQEIVKLYWPKHVTKVLNSMWALFLVTALYVVAFFIVIVQN